MSKQDTIISLLKEINENVDNLEQISIVKDIVVSENDKEYIPADYGADAFGKVKTELRHLVKVSSFKVTNDCINEEGRWEGDVLIDVSNCTDLSKIFHSVSKLRFIDVSNWDTSNVTTLYDAFFNCNFLKELDVSNWDVSNVRSMGDMFHSCYQLEILDFSNWNVSNVANVNNLFRDCRRLKTLINNRNIDDVLVNNISCLSGLKISFSLSSTVLDRASIRAVINGIADLTGQTAQTLTLGETLIAKLTEEDIAIATAKNWTIA